MHTSPRRKLKRLVATLFVLASGYAALSILWPENIALAELTPVDVVEMLVAGFAGVTSLAVVWSLWRDPF